MSTLGIIFSFIGSLVFLFLYWRRLKEDYSSTQIFSSAFYILFLVFGVALLTKFFIIPRLTSTSVFVREGLWFWGGFLGFLLGFFLGFWRFHLRLFETLEASTLGGFFLIFCIFVADTIEKNSLTSLIASTIILLLMGLLVFLSSKYRNFVWYRSGKIGFSGLVAAGVFFLLRALVALTIDGVLSFVGKFDALLSATAAFIAFYAVYNLAQEE